MRIRYLTEEPPPNEVLTGFERSGVSLSVAEALDDPHLQNESFEAVLYDAATLESSDDDLHRLRNGRPAVPVIGVVEALDGVGSVPTALDPVVDGWIEKPVLRATPGHVVSLLHRATEYRGGEPKESGTTGTGASESTHGSDERLRTKNRCLESLRASLSHDLRNPLMVAHEYTILGRDTGNDEYLDRADSAIKRATALIDELVAVARAGRGITTLVGLSIREVATETWEGIDTDSATLTVETDRFVRADRSLLGLFFEVVFDRMIDTGSGTVRVDADDSGVLITGVGPDGSPDQYHALRRALVDPDSGTAGPTLLAAIADAHDWGVELAQSDDEFRLHVIT